MRALHDATLRTFASDNYAGAHPEVIAAVSAANFGHVRAYGADPYSEHLGEVVCGLFGDQAGVYPVFNGTGANVVALQALTDRWGAVICASSAHITADEGGAPERMAGLKLLGVDSRDGKLTPELVDRQAWGFGDDHRAQPQVVSITQPTEMGTLYTRDELVDLTEHAHTLGLAVHMDGARIANAAAGLDLPMRAFTTDVGVDSLSLGATKNGAMLAEAVVTLTARADRGIAYIRKSSMQLASKARFVSAQLLALYDGDLWLRCARHANDMASRLGCGLSELPEVELTHPVQANSVFAVLPKRIVEGLRDRFGFYDWDRDLGEVRLVCAWDTTLEDVDAFVVATRRALD
jgi:threonine aldolase